MNLPNVSHAPLLLQDPELLAQAAMAESSRASEASERDARTQARTARDAAWETERDARIESAQHRFESAVVQSVGDGVAAAGQLAAGALGLRAADTGSDVRRAETLGRIVEASTGIARSAFQAGAAEAKRHADLRDVDVESARRDTEHARDRMTDAATAADAMQGRASRALDALRDTQRAEQQVALALAQNVRA